MTAPAAGFAEELSNLDRAHMLHPFTALAGHAQAGPMVMVSGKGSRLTDARGQEYLDAFAGLWCVNVGYGREEIADAVAEQIRKLCYFHSFLSMGNEPSIRLADRLARMTPASVNKAFFGLTGSDGNDTQIKIAWHYNNLLGRPNKKKVIARHGAYHGVTVASASLSGLPNLHGGFDLPIDRFLHVTKPHHYRFAEPGETEEQFSARLARELEDLIVREDPETIAAFFAEPVMGAGGVFPPPKGYFEAIVPVLRKYDILFVADEVICGFGRLGTPFGSDYFNLEPDMMTLAKGLTSGYVPMSACMISDKIWQVLCEGTAKMGPFGHGFTYSGHPVSAAAALANLDIYERESIFDRARKTGAYLQSRLREKVSGHPLVGEVRGIGMVAALELVADKKTKQLFDPAIAVQMRVYRKIVEKRVIVRPIPNIIAIAPPLVFTEAEIDELIAALALSLDEAAGELKSEGLWKS